MTTPLQVVRADDPARFLATDETVWFPERSAVPAEQQLLGLPPEHRFAVETGDEGDEGAQGGADSRDGYAGVYGVFPVSLAVPSPGGGLRRVPCAGLTWVGVHPDHRRRGVLTAMMRHHLEQVHEDREWHVSALHASEPAIYGRFGYGSASLEHEVTLGRGTTLVAPHLEDVAAATTTRMGMASDPEVPARMHACHTDVPELGQVVFAPEFYQRMCQQLPEHSRDKEPLRVLFARRDGRDVGFALFRRIAKWEHARPAGELTVWAFAGDAGARLALLRRLLDFDLVTTVKLRAAGVDDPAVAWAGGPRAVSELVTYDSLWVRLVDLPEALQERSWSAPCDVVAEVADPVAPWNDGRWRIRVAESGEVEVGQVGRAGREADVHLPVAALGAAYLGGGNLVSMLAAGLVVEQRRGAVAELWRAMRTDVPPTGAWMF